MNALDYGQGRIPQYQPPQLVNALSNAIQLKGAMEGQKQRNVLSGQKTEAYERAKAADRLKQSIAGVNRHFSMANENNWVQVVNNYEAEFPEMKGRISTTYPGKEAHEDLLINSVDPEAKVKEIISGRKFEREQEGEERQAGIKASHDLDLEIAKTYGREGLENLKAGHASKLQAQKDTAAMKRERVKGANKKPLAYGGTQEEWEEKQARLQKDKLAIIEAKGKEGGKLTEKQKEGAKKQKLASDRYFQTIGRYYQAQRGVGQFIADPNKEQVAGEALEAAETLAIKYVKDGGKAEDLGITAEGIKADYEAKRIDKKKAVYLLKELFGMK